MMACFPSEVDENTQIVGKISTISDALKLMRERGWTKPRPGWELTVDTGTVTLHGEMGSRMHGEFPYRTYLQNNAGSLRVWTYISVCPVGYP